MIKKNILYLSYDGLADQLAKSQIFPYLDILNEYFNVYVLTCEKSENYTKLKLIKDQLKQKSMEYFYLNFSKKFYFISIFRLLDSLKIFFSLIKIIKKNKIIIVHARGHIPAYICFLLSFFLKIKFVFDFRGLWIEERLDNNALNKKKFIGNLIFKILKYLEKKTLQKAYKIVVLTEKLKNKFILEHKIIESDIYVMPCYVNTDFFNNISKNKKFDIYSKLEIPENSKIICYLGSIGGFYLMDEMLSFFSKLKKKHKEYFFLIITKQKKEIQKLINNSNDQLVMNSTITKTLEFEKVPLYLSKVNLSIFFLKHSNARIGTCPIKFPESLSLGIPVICNNKIGDIDSYFKNNKIGTCFNIYDKKSVDKVIDNINTIENFSKSEIKKYAKSKFSINNAYNKYKLMYINEI